MAGDPCPRCKKNVTRAQGGIQCRTCTKWFHFPCVSGTYSKEAEKSFGKWQCNRCKEATNTPKTAAVGTPNSQKQQNLGNPKARGENCNAPSSDQTPPPVNDEPLIIRESRPTQVRGTLNAPLPTASAPNATPNGTESHSETCNYCHTQAEASTSFCCFFCNEWEHASCRGIHSDIVLAIKLHDPQLSLFRYECSSCSKRKVAQLQLQVRLLTDCRIPEQRNQNPFPGDQALYSRVAQHGTTDSRQNTPSPAPSANTTVETLLRAEKEKQLREAKRFNLVISGVPESETPDAQIALGLCRTNDLGATLETGDIVETRRLGRPSDNGRPRKLLVKLREDTSTFVKRNNILKNARNLRTSDDAFTRREIYIGPDLTPLQLQSQAEKRRLKRAESSAHNRNEEASSGQGQQ